MNSRQEKAIKAVNKALKELNLSGVKICGMDGDLLYATEEAIEQYKDTDRQRRPEGDYCPVARAYQFGDDDTGMLYSKGYLDSGGW